MGTRTVRSGGRATALLAALGAAALLAASPAVGSPPAAAPASSATGLPVPTFSDVPADHPFAEEIAWLVAEGVTTGYPDGTFRPTAPVSRQAMATWVARIYSAPTPLCTSSPFPDVPVENEHCGAIAVMGAGGVMTGYADGLFRPSAPISRQAGPAVLARAGGAGVLPVCTTPPFPDVATTNQFCPVIRAMVLGGITTGYADGLYHPTAPVTRQAMAAWLFRIYAEDDGPGGPIELPDAGPAWAVAAAG